MRSIRNGVFETNSSSTHSICICSEDEFNKWIGGEGYFNESNGSFLTKEQVDTVMNYDSEDTEDDKAQARRDECIYTYDEYTDWDFNGNTEFYSARHTTHNGDKVIAFGTYGENR